MKFKVVIPARLGSTRLPRKVLRDIAGKPLVRHVWEAARASGAEQVVIATDDETVAKAARDFGAEVRLTEATHQSGTDRVNEVARAEGWERDCVVVNLQGDEPLMPPALIREAARLLDEDSAADIATFCHPLHSAEDWLNPNVVKLVKDRRGYALYFSRAPIPWKRDPASATDLAAHMPPELAYRHIGLYAYRVGSLSQFSELPPGDLEQCEALEQLRALSHGFRIRVGVTQNPPPRGVDTEEDLAAVAAILSRR
ncbi:3-deoxy-manno-octulosonate cytidylyltransferase (CMP-KDO synthetase) [Panacagrimonas perspica]|uniref:3-deoxy-manno-octulosonate cytidylyltransferase n=1 Tax=Panacagrimonas perspica TaxID=381431 RepID=A0A4S3K0J1_9GAMM|nr:3-deoxy-manno-octulosonate cytidylyltransferase [Panacagrimonas perspica]TDU22462.1 3-deoxy-manno-octulosonate cytidylyltransferase (CMP-KDO synthetase) [Panacagrimonas perspica]THD01406.1 3-deoxy-manno-octulosonate cytidylyltransferase [Panacagrimonas perspica]